MARKFKLNWKVTLFAAVCLVAFLRLGFWQLDREQEKVDLLADRSTKLLEAPLGADELLLRKAESGTQVRLSGVYDSNVILLKDNVVFEGKVGFEVHQLFEDDGGLAFLVNRGFVSMGRTRQDPVEIPPAGTGELTLTGSVYTGQGAPLLLKESEGLSESYPTIVQRINIDQLAAATGKEIYPFVIRLSEGQQTALPRYWPDTVMSPEKHFGYALQWFTMALAVTIAWIFFSFRKEENQ